MVFYPDNVPRRDRALQLQNDISVLQFGVQQARQDLDRADERMVPLINQVMAKNGLKTYDQLRDKLMSTLTDEQKKMYDALFESNKAWSFGTDSAIMAMSGLVLTTSIIRKTIDIGNVLRAVNIVSIFQGYGRAFITLVTEGWQAGVTAFKAVRAGIKAAVEGLEASSKAARYAATASRWLKTIAFLGLVADAFTLALDAYEQHKQRDELRKAIAQIYVSRISAQFFTDMCNSIKTWNGILMGYLVIAGSDSVDEATQSAADLIAKKYIEFVQKDWKDITAANALDKLVVLDKKRGSWTTEDPAYDDALKSAEEDIDIKMKQDTTPAPAPDTVTTNVAADEMVLESKVEVESESEKQLVQDLSVAEVAPAYLVAQPDPELRGVLKEHHHSVEKMHRMLSIAAKDFEPAPVEKIFNYLVYIQDLTAEDVVPVAAVL
ncbi:hypothetical protein CERSUDRAFT_111847 [Gelatoporia subvermispora B]|uniref:Uncharacterized protein n=1 Tax=Ceriporiopsis subvermispora (strain B) TaxID=914234 RepID=M2RM29_CERS8|nr:hypothetical protein CERSUDRAFT_111847 [Gelatoporia subvermispora B]